MNPANRKQTNFEASFEGFRKQLWLFILHKVPSQEAEDVFQTVCLQAYKAFRTMKDPGKLKAMAFTIARRRIQDFYRGQNATVELENRIPIADLAQSEPFSPEQRLLLRAIPDMIRTLGEPYREIAIMHFLLGLTGQEIAAILDENYNTVKSQIRRGKVLLFNNLRATHGALHETQ